MTNKKEYTPVKLGCNGAVVDFPFKWKILDAEDLIILLENDETEEQIQLEYGKDYSVDFADMGGNVITKTVYSAGYSIIVSRKVSQYQGKTFQTTSGFQGSEIEKSYDRLSANVQDLDYTLQRAIKVPVGSKVLDLTLPNPVAGRTLKWNEKETGLVNSDVSIDEIDSFVASAKQSAISSEEQAVISQQYSEISEKCADDATQRLKEIAEEHENSLVDIYNSKTDAVEACEYEVVKAKRYAEESGGKGMPTDICKRLNIEYDTENRKVKLRWKDPADTINSLGQIMSTWAGTILTCKENSYPVNYDDGTILVNNKKRNQYENTVFEYSVPENITDITTLKFRVFPYSANDVYNKDNRNCFDKAIVYELLLEDNNSSPKGCISYPEGSMNENFKPAFMDYSNQVFDYGSWKDAFFMDLFKPCMLKSDGTVDYYLHPDDYTKKADGVTPSDVANKDYDGNAMMEIGQFWIKTRKENGKIHAYIANKQIDEDYHCWTHYNKNGTLLPYIYRALYDGSNVNNKIRSISGQAPCVNVAGNTQIAYAQANGEGYDIDEYSLRDALNWLLLLIGKSTDTQTVFGTGRHSGGSAQNYNQIVSGTLDKKGIFWGDNNNGAVKVFGIENWWGNVWLITNGILQTGNKLYMKLTPGTQDGSTVEGYQQTSVEGYIDTGITLSGTSGGYISKMELVEGKGLLPSVVSGSSSTYFCDGCWWNGGLIGFARFGSSAIEGYLTGSFALALNLVTSIVSVDFGVSLSYKQPL